MKRYKNNAVAVIFLITFLGCIGVNCARNINLLCHTDKIQEYGLAGATIKTTGAAVYLLMDKKENDTHKNPCSDLLISKSYFRHFSGFSSNCAIVAKSVGTRLIYMTVRNLRI